MLAQSPCFVPSGDSEFTDAGTNRHKYLHALHLAGAVEDYGRAAAEVAELLTEEECEAVKWAYDYIRLHAPMLDHPIHFERRMVLLNADFEEIFPGTPDVACGPDLFDLKWRERDYTAQMAAYALMMMQENSWPEVRVHVLYAESRRAVVFKFTEEQAGKIVFDIIKSVDAHTEPKPGDYCGWCAKRLTCPAITKAVETVSKGYSDLDRVKNWHPSQMETGEEIDVALWIWRNVLKKWGESIEFHALEAVQKKGITLPSFELKTESGGKYLTDVPGAFAAVGLPQAEFLKCCDMRMNTSKTYPDKVGIVETYASFHGQKKAPAKREIESKLGDLLKDKKPKVYLKAIKSTTENEGEE